MAKGPDHDWWSLLDQILTGAAWVPFIRIVVLLVILGGITAAIVFALGPLAAGLGAGGTVATGAGKRYLTRRRRNRTK